MEEEARYKATMADKHYRQQLQVTNASRQEYFQIHLPKILTVRKEYMHAYSQLIFLSTAGTQGCGGRMLCGSKVPIGPVRLYL
jgi:hypothetical protein